MFRPFVISLLAFATLACSPSQQNASSEGDQQVDLDTTEETDAVSIPAYSDGELADARSNYDGQHDDIDAIAADDRKKVLAIGLAETGHPIKEPYESANDDSYGPGGHLVPDFRMAHTQPENISRQAGYACDGGDTWRFTEWVVYWNGPWIQDGVGASSSFYYYTTQNLDGSVTIHLTNQETGKKTNLKLSGLRGGHWKLGKDILELCRA